MTTVRKYQTNLLSSFLSLFLGMILATWASESFAKHHPLLGYFLCFLAAGSVWSAIHRYGLAHFNLSKQLQRESHQQSQSASEAETIRRAQAKVDADTKAQEEPTGKFDPLTFYSPTYIGTSLHPDAIGAVINYHVKLLGSHPLIILFDAKIGRYVMLVNRTVEWVREIDVASMERELVGMEICRRVYDWVYKMWGEQPTRTDKDNYITDMRNHIMLGHMASGKSILDALTGSVEQRTEMIGEFTSTMLQHKPACVNVSMENAAELPRGSMWTDEAILERFVLRLPIPGWLGFTHGYVALAYDITTYNIDGSYNGTALEDQTIREVIEGSVFVATKGLSKASDEAKAERFTLETFIFVE